MAETTHLTPRPSSLEGRRVGLLWNGKTNADILLRAIGDRLISEYGAKHVVWLDKKKQASGSSRPSPEWMIDRLVRETDVVLTASGD